MATVTERTWTNKKGTQRAWVVSYTDGNGKRHIETFGRKGEATSRRIEIESAVKAGTHTPAHKSPTVAEAGEAWIKQAETDGLERATTRQYRQHLDHIVPLLGQKKLSDLTIASVKSFRNDLIAAGRSRVMAKKIVSNLGAILADAQSGGRVSQNVVRAEIQANKTATRRRRMVERRQEQKIQEGVDYPTKDELRRMMAVSSVPDRRGRRGGAIDPADLPQRPILGWHALVVTAIFSGLRASELRGLRWSDVNFPEKQIEVRQRADRFNVIGAPKSASGWREVPMGPYLENTLKAWQLECPKGKLDLVFPNSKGRVETLPTIHNRVLAPLQKTAGIESPHNGPKYGMHSLRHAAASLWIEQHPPKRVQYLMGHSTIQMTFDVYGHLWREETETEAAAALEKRLVG
jgi:integrase